MSEPKPILRLLPKEEPKPELNWTLIEELSRCLSEAQQGTLKDCVLVRSMKDGSTLSYVKDNDNRFAAYASILLANRAIE